MEFLLSAGVIPNCSTCEPGKVQLSPDMLELLQNQDKAAPKPKPNWRGIWVVPPPSAWSLTAKKWPLDQIQGENIKPGFGNFT